MAAAAAVAGSAVLGYMGQKSAQASAEGMNARNMAQQERQWKLTDPFSATGQRSQYVSQLNALMRGGYAGIQEDPMYRFMAAQGLDMAQRGASATGTAQSGAEQIALQQQGQGLARSFFDEQYQRLASLSGAGSRVAGPSSQLTPGDAYEMSMGRTAAMGGMLSAAGQIFGKYGGNIFGTGESGGGGGTGGTNMSAGTPSIPSNAA